MIKLAAALISKYTSLFTGSLVQNYSRSSVPELADGNSIQVLSSSASEDQLSDHNE